MASTLPPTEQGKSILQDNQNKTAFALDMMKRIPQEKPAPVEQPKIPSLGAAAIAN